MRLSNLRSDLLLNAKNIPGKGTKKKIVVIECDDWGGIRTPSNEVYENLTALNLADRNCRYRFDTIASVEDLEVLFHTLRNIKGKNGHSAVMTAVSNVANPDFKAIRENGFSEYHYEKLTDTFNRYGNNNEIIKTWRKGYKEGIFVPELHGREHVSVQFWLQKLREGNKDLLHAFDQEYISLPMYDPGDPVNGFRAEFYFESDEQIPFLQNSISDAVQIFQDTFGFMPSVFVPSNGIFHPVFEPAVAEAGIKYLHVFHFNRIPDKKGRMRLKYYKNGKKTADGLRYYVRNCAFEPSDPAYKGIEYVLSQIESAFRWGKPAIISTHRVNFIGSLNPENREFGIKELQNLLSSIMRIWPEAEFKSSFDMLNTIYKQV